MKHPFVAQAAIAVALDATRRYKTAVKFVASMDLASTVLVALAIKRNDAPLLYVAFGALGGIRCHRSVRSLDRAFFGWGRSRSRGRLRFV